MVRRASAQRAKRRGPDDARTGRCCPGDARIKRRRPGNGRITQRGLSYVWALLLVGLFAASSATAFRLESSLSTRARESDLLWVGEQFRKAIRDYHMDSQGKSERYPTSLEELTDPPARPGPRRYLRRVYLDPMTGSRQWGLIRTRSGGIIGVYSTAAGKPMRATGFRQEEAHFAEADSYRDWVFAYDPAGLLRETGKAR